MPSEIYSGSGAAAALRAVTRGSFPSPLPVSSALEGPCCVGFEQTFLVLPPPPQLRVLLPSFRGLTLGSADLSALNVGVTVTQGPARACF